MVLLCVNTKHLQGVMLVLTWCVVSTVQEHVKWEAHCFPLRQVTYSHNALFPPDAQPSHKNTRKPDLYLFDLFYNIKLLCIEGNSIYTFCVLGFLGVERWLILVQDNTLVTGLKGVKRARGISQAKTCEPEHWSFIFDCIGYSICNLLQITSLLCTFVYPDIM